MIYIIVVLVLMLFCSMVYIELLQMQMKRISRILKTRECEQGTQLVSLDMINRNLSELAQSINTCLKAEEKLRLNAVSEEKQYKELIANISHDLRTPLTVIKGYQQLLNHENENLNEDQKQKLKIAIKSTDELGVLISHFFEYSYLVNHEPEIHIETLNLSNLVAECLSESVGMMEDKGISVNYKPMNSCHVAADRESMTRIVQNLIRNVCQHANGTVEVSITQSEEEAVLSMMNKISDDFTIDTQHLFDRFYTGEGKKATTTGLGLAIVKILTERMGGRVSARLCQNDTQLKISIIIPSVTE